MPDSSSDSSSEQNPSLPEKVDVIIAGAGITGSSCLYHLARHTDLDVLCLEKQRTNYGSTARSAAAFRHQFTSRVNIQMSLYSGKMYETFSEQIGKDPVFLQNGYLFLYSRENLLEEATKHVQRQRDEGVESVSILSPDEIHQKFSYVETSELAGATWCPRDGYIRPEKTARSFIRAAFREQSQSQNLQLEERCPVTDVQKRNGNIAGIIVNDQTRVKTEKLINAAGVWGVDIARKAGAPIPVLPVKRYLYFTNQLENRNIRDWGLHVFDLNQYLRPEDNGLMLGSETRPEKPESFEAYWETPERTDDLYTKQDRIEEGFGTGIHDYGYEILAAAAEQIPFLMEEVGIENVSSGYYQITPDEKAIISRDPRVKGLIHAVGFSGHGVMHAPATGRAVKDLVLEQDSPFELEHLRIDDLLDNTLRPDPEGMVI